MWQRSVNTDRARMYKGAWPNAARTYLATHPRCVRCEQAGKIVEAECVDHIRPHRGDLMLFWNESNWQALCKKCHDIKTAREDMHVPSMPETLQPASCKLILVCGAPGAGKSTLVAQRRGDDDIVIDLDEIKNRHDSLTEALAERNEMLHALAEAPRHVVAWLIVCAAIRRRMWWQRKLEPQEVVVLTTPLAECIERITRDAARLHERQERIAAARAWWREEIGA